MAAQPQPRLTPQQYLELERAAEFRHEYYNGRMYAMPGGTYNHARITANLIGALFNVLEPTKCAVSSSDLRVRVSPDGLYTYPDVSVACSQPHFADDEGDTLTNPVVICEVLSPSSEAYDRGFKFAQYRQIPSVREYLLVSQFEPRVELFRRQEGGAEWMFSDHAGMDASLHLSSIGCELRLASIYDKIIFQAAPPPRPHP
jgi:Uma2 family endonuclease